ncbi:anti-CBASS protein Acb1 family protein [Borrelia miyamotoi]|nr:anti-CBASS Acb1 family protein [Borrelia miyamotoi]WVI05600.1 anti-CBASS Acb1 family protein [Borrelia miyamotoi]
MSLRFKVNARDLYKYSIFFRNYIENVAEDVLKNGISLQSTSSSVTSMCEELDKLKLELKESLMQCIISCRFNGVGYILVKTADQKGDLHLEVNSELPIGFMYLDYSKVQDLGPESSHINYYLKSEAKDISSSGFTTLKIHKSRLIVYSNYDYILGAYSPCYSESFLLDVYLLEKIYQEIEKRIETHNFLFYKDESLSHIKDALSTAAMSKESKNRGNFFKEFFTSTKSKNENNDTSISNTDDELVSELARLKSNLDNNGIFYSCETDASMEVIKYDMNYLKEALALVKAKIGADTKEPLTRSFNEQVKGLGSDGKGDRSNYYDFLKSVQEKLEIAINSKLVKYFSLKMHFGSLIILGESEKIERDIKLLEMYEKYIFIMSTSNLSLDEKINLKNKLFIKIGEE